MKYGFCIVLLCAAAALAGQGETVFDPDADAELILDDLLTYIPPTAPPAPNWQADFDLRLGGGYKENVLYSAVIPKDSPFTLIEAELFVLREAELPHELWLYTFGDQRHYTDLTRGDNEYTFITEAHWNVRQSSGSALLLDASYYYIDQFFDASVTEVETDSFRLVQHDMGARAAYEAHLGRFAAATFGGTAHDVTLEGSTDDYVLYEGFADCRLLTERADTLGLLYRRQVEDYDQRSRREAAGERMEGGMAKLDVNGLRLYALTHLDAGQKWQVGMTVEARDRNDNGGGYYDSRAIKTGFRLRSRWSAWKAGLGVEFTRADFEQRPVDLQEPDGDLLYRNRWISWLRIERSLYRRGSLFMHFNREEYSSNEPLDTYKVLFAVAGLGYMF